MKSELETLNPTRVKLTVEVPFEELEPSLDAAYKKIGSQVTIPGFRKGKVPPRVIDQRFGRGTVLEEAVNEALPRFYGQAVEENEVQVLGQPEVDVTEFEDGQHLQFTAEVDVRPEFDLPDYDGLEVTVDDAEVTDADVDEQLDGLRERFATLTGVDRAAADGDFVSIDLSAAIDGEADRRPDRQGPELPGRRGLAARRPRRGRDRPVRGRVRGLRHDPGRRRPRRPGGDRHRRGEVGQGARAARAGRRLRPDRQRVRHPRGAARRRAHPGGRDEEGASRASRPATASSRRCSSKVDLPLPEGVVKAEIDCAQPQPRPPARGRPA